MSKIPQLARDVPDPGPPPTPVKTLTRWAQFLGAVAAGEGIPESKMKHYITNADIEACTRSDPLEMQRWQDARLAGTKTQWTVLQFDEVCDRIAAGAKIRDAIVAVKGEDTGTFYRLVNRDSDMNRQFLEAQAAGMIVLGEDILDIADDTSRDTLEGPKGGEIPNMAAVTRDKLRIEARNKRMGQYHAKLFGEKKDNVQVNVQINHAETLEAARTREKLRDKRVTPAQMQAAIDATFSEKPVDNDTSWMDEKPADSQWREEQ